MGAGEKLCALVRLIPNGQAVPEAGGGKGAGEAGLEWCQSSFPGDSQAETDF